LRRSTHGTPVTTRQLKLWAANGGFRLSGYEPCTTQLGLEVVTKFERM